MTGRVLARVLLASAAAVALATRTTAAQQRPDARVEARVDAFAGSGHASAQLGGGIALPLGTYARLAMLGGAGAVIVDGDEADDRVAFSARMDLLARFLVDPIRQSRWGPYIAAGVSARSDAGACCDGFLSLLVGVEGPYAGDRTWAFELGFGGGVRAAVVLRAGGERWR